MRGLTKMAKVIVKMRVMPESTEVDLEGLEKQVREKVTSFAESENAVNNVETSPVAFGLKALDVTFAVDESKGDTETLEEEIGSMEEVASVEITSVSRALG